MKKFFSNLKSKVCALYSKNKKLFIITIILLAVILVCLFYYPSISSNDDSKTKNIAKTTTSDDYVAVLEAKIENMLLSFNEITRVSVMVVCESSEVTEYLKNTTESTSENSSSTTEEVAYEKNGSNNQPIVVKTIMPKIVGVWVVVNDISASTKIGIINSLSTVLNVDQTSISILQER